MSGSSLSTAGNQEVEDVALLSKVRLDAAQLVRVLSTVACAGLVTVAGTAVSRAAEDSAAVASLSGPAAMAAAGAGRVTAYPGIAGPVGIAAGPDGAL